MEEISEELSILAAIRRGESAADAGRVIPHVEIKRRSVGVDYEIVWTEPAGGDLEASTRISRPDKPPCRRYSSDMKPTETPMPAVHIGHVKNGVVVLDPHVSLAEGQAVRVEPLSPAEVAADRDRRLQQLRQLFDQWTQEDAQLSDEEADRLQQELNRRQRVRFRAAGV